MEVTLLDQIASSLMLLNISILPFIATILAGVAVAMTCKINKKLNKFLKENKL